MELTERPKQPGAASVQTLIRASARSYLASHRLLKQ